MDSSGNSCKTFIRKTKPFSIQSESMEQTGCSLRVEAESRVSQVSNAERGNQTHDKRFLIDGSTI